MDQKLALEVMTSGKSVFLTGPAGSGKTFILNEFIHRARSAGKKVAVTATTGLAASHLGGSTIHSWSGIGIHDQIPNNFFTHLSQSRRDQLTKTNVLIIDEISMLHAARLDMIDEILRRVRDNKTPFGGIQIILCGDFFQLPPVTRGASNGDAQFVVSSESWKELEPVICYLEEQHRQDDDQYLEILQALRSDTIRRSHAEILLNKVDTIASSSDVTELHTVNLDVDRINATKLDSLPGDEVSFEMTSTGGVRYVESLKKSCLAPQTLILKKDALVMTIKNSPQKRYFNGSLGRVVGFEDDTLYPVVKFKNGTEHTIQPESWELRDGDKKRAGIYQIPLRLAYAITVHKSQGMTLDSAKIDLRRAFVEGMGYVALSRVRNLQSLSLHGINRMALRVSAEALEIDRVLRSKAQQHAKDFEYLRDLSKEKSRIETTKTKSNTWSEKISVMRETHPNAYRPWTKQHDATLKEKFQLGESVAAISKILGRHEGSIRLRIQKHFGDDAVS